MNVEQGLSRILGLRSRDGAKAVDIADMIIEAFDPSDDPSETREAPPHLRVPGGESSNSLKTRNRPTAFGDSVAERIASSLAAMYDGTETETTTRSDAASGAVKPTCGPGEPSAQQAVTHEARESDGDRHDRTARAARFDGARQWLHKWDSALREYDSRIGSALQAATAGEPASRGRNAIAQQRVWIQGLPGQRTGALFALKNESESAVSPQFRVAQPLCGQAIIGDVAVSLNEGLELARASRLVVRVDLSIPGTARPGDRYAGAIYVESCGAVFARIALDVEVL